jgi:hypothetical protein
MVTGIVGQLLAMDPTLSAADLKNLLLAGARDSVERADGVNVAPSPVSGISDVVYEADAYGSLRLLSARAGRPLCGANVSVARTTAPASDSVPFAVSILRYRSTTPELLTVDADGRPLIYPEQWGPVLSVAPGGRAIAATSGIYTYEAQTNLFNLQAGAWRATQKLPGLLGLLFGERDTLRLEEDGAVFATTTGRLPKRAYPHPDDEAYFPQSFAFAPDGSAFSYATRAATPFAPQNVWTVARTGTGTSITIGSETGTPAVL